MTNAPALQLAGTLAGSKLLDAGDLGRWKAAVAAAPPMGWGYHFAHLLTQNRTGSSAMLLVEDAGSLCLFRWRLEEEKPRLDLYLPPLPFQLDVLRRCLERANDFNGDRSARVLRVDAKDAAALGEVDGLRVKPRRLQYVFAPSQYENLAGGKLRNVRRYVQAVEAMPGVQVVPYEPSHAAACRELLVRWQRAHRAAHGTAGGAGSSRRVLELAGTLPERDLRGEVVLIGGELRGFAFGGEIRPGLGCAFERKCDFEVRGLTWFQLRSLLLLLRDHALVNDGSDAGRPGLKQLKDSFRPVEMHGEFRASQRGGRAAD